MVYTWLTNWDSSFLYRNVPSRLKYLLEWQHRTLIGQYGNFFVACGSRLAGVSRLHLHCMYIMSTSCCPYVLGISQLDCYFLCWLLTRCSKIKGPGAMSLSEGFLNGLLLWVLWWMVWTRDVTTVLSWHYNVYGWLRTGRNWGLAVVLPCKRLCKNCSATELYWYMWPAWLCHIFPHYLLKKPIFGKKDKHRMCVMIFSTNLSETFLILKRTGRDIAINVHRYPCQVPVILVRF